MDAHKGHTDFSESEEKRTLRTNANARVSRWCCYVALVVILVDFAAFVLGASDAYFMQMGIMVSIALLAFAGIQYYGTR